MADDGQRGALFRPIVPNQHSPRHLCRIVVRSGVRVRGHADLAHAACAVHPARGIADDAVVSRRLVGVGLHLLDHQLAQPRTHAGPDPAVSADARRARALDLDPEGLRIAGIVVRRRLRDDAGRPNDLFLLVIDPVHPAFGTNECDPHPGLAVGIGRVLDRGRLCGRTAAADFGPSRWRSNMSRRRSGSGSRDTARLRWPTGSSRAAIWQSAAPASSSSRSANPSW